MRQNNADVGVGIGAQAFGRLIEGLLQGVYRLLDFQRGLVDILATPFKFRLKMLFFYYIIPYFPKNTTR